MRLLASAELASPCIPHIIPHSSPYSSRGTLSLVQDRQALTLRLAGIGKCAVAGDADGGIDGSADADCSRSALVGHRGRRGCLRQKRCVTATLPLVQNFQSLAVRLAGVGEGGVAGDADRGPEGEADAAITGGALGRHWGWLGHYRSRWLGQWGCAAWTLVQDLELVAGRLIQTQGRVRLTAVADMQGNRSVAVQQGRAI